jgi:hypothetical protein
MLRYAPLTSTLLYPVEVSGWDSGQNFFVETCDLTWNEEAGKQVAINQRLGDSAILFVRLLQAGESERSHPVVYRAELVGESQNGMHQFRLNAVAPRPKER